jgi:lipoprotein-anchoring transpeptidase ErfK/SrfK
MLPLLPRAALPAILLLLSLAAARAESFTPGTFQIFGGMDGGSREVTAAQRAPGAVPQHLRSREIDFASPLPEGSILVRTGARRLYYILGGGRAIEYHVGVGREGFTWSGTDVISRKAE